MNSSLH